MVFQFKMRIMEISIEIEREKIYRVLVMNVLSKHYCITDDRRAD
jgi:hypothetical protein